MSKLQSHGGKSDQAERRRIDQTGGKDSFESGPQGPSLKLLYTALAFALAAAIGLALLIVLPFYHRG